MQMAFTWPVILQTESENMCVQPVNGQEDMYTNQEFILSVAKCLDSCTPVVIDTVLDILEYP